MSLEGDKASLAAHTDALKGELLNKCTESEEREHQFKQLQAEFSEAGQKHAKDLENVAVQVKQLEAQVLVEHVFLSNCIMKSIIHCVSLKQMFLYCAINLYGSKLIT